MPKKITSASMAKSHYDAGRVVLLGQVIHLLFEALRKEGHLKTKADVKVYWDKGVEGWEEDQEVLVFDLEVLE
jgi:hypothetical protein